MIKFNLVLVFLLITHQNLISKQPNNNYRIDVSEKVLEKLKSENDYNNLYSNHIGGIREQRYTYKGSKHIFVDIETKTEVIEGGLDKRSSLDSIQQAGFFAFLTGKKPIVVIYDTDGKEGIYEYRIKKACQFYGMEYRNVVFY